MSPHAIKHLFLGIVFVFLSNLAIGQVVLKRSVIGSGGGFKNASGSSLAIINTSGQSSAIQRQTSKRLVLLQGFIQPLNLRAQVELFETTVYPNPSEGLIYVSRKDQLEKLEVSVFSLEGRLVGKFEVQPNHGKLDLSKLPKGIYNLMFLSDGRHVGVKKIMLR